MSRYAWILLVPALALVSCSRSPSPKSSSITVSNPTSSSTVSDAVTDYTVGEPVRYENLTIFPIASRSPRDEDRFTTLDEGLRAGSVEVFEVGGGSTPETPLPEDSLGDLFGGPPALGDPFEGDGNSVADNSFRDDMDPFASGHGHDDDLPRGAEVNRVMVINRSAKPLYLMPGEIILGGDQDRCVAGELVLQPSEEAIPVAVFCVEHGRWGHRAHADTARFVGNALAAAEESVSLSSNVDTAAIAKDANNGKFIASVGALNAKARMTVQGSQDQSAVWDVVSSVNADYGIDTGSDAFTGNYVDETSLARLEPYHDALLARVPEVENVIGVIAAVNGKVQALDLFESTPLFRKLWPKLLKSYALDAANTADSDDARTYCHQEDAEEFLQKSMRADIEESAVKHGIAVTRRASEEIVTFAAEDDTTSGAGFGGGGFGGVHTAAFSK